MKTILSQLKALEVQKKDLLEQLKIKKGNQKFLCVCGKMHKFNACTAVTIEKYRPSQGYEDGYTYDADIRIICPATNVANRLLFNDHPDYYKRQQYKYNAEAQFKRNYPLDEVFKAHETVEDDKETRKWDNNYYIDKNHAKYGINITGENK